MANLRPLTLQRSFCSLTTGSNPIPTRTQAMSSGSNERMFQLKYDPVTGMSEWVVVEGDDNHNNNDNVVQPSSSIDLGTTSYLDMLNDNWRNKAYRLAIDKTVTRPCCVLDIGAGTGLLSMMAARAMGITECTLASDDKGRVIACESYLPMVKLMRKIVRRNGMERKVRVINKRSDELKVGVDIDSRAHILMIMLSGSIFSAELEKRIDETQLYKSELRGTCCFLFLEYP